MRRYATVLGGGLLILGSWATAALATDSAADQFGKTSKGAEKTLSTKERMLADFDANGDGKLSETERRAARTALAKQRKIAQAADSEQNSDSQSGLMPPGALAGYGMGGSSNSSVNPYSMTGNSYLSGSGLNPYALTGQSGMSGYYYGMAVFGATGQGAGGGGGGCMSGGGGMGTMGGRR